VSSLDAEGEIAPRAEEEEFGEPAGEIGTPVACAAAAAEGEGASCCCVAPICPAMAVVFIPGLAGRETTGLVVVVAFGLTGRDSVASALPLGPRPAAPVTIAGAAAARATVGTGSFPGVAKAMGAAVTLGTRVTAAEVGEESSTMSPSGRWTCTEIRGVEGALEGEGEDAAADESTTPAVVGIPTAAAAAGRGTELDAVAGTDSGFAASAAAAASTERVHPAFAEFANGTVLVGTTVAAAWFVAVAVAGAVTSDGALMVDNAARIVAGW
jgi:hypothetical protein